jgi:hypothetical protein
MELAFAAMHQLCAPLLNRVEQLPDPQRDALEDTFGVRGGGTAVEPLAARCTKLCDS